MIGFLNRYRNRRSAFSDRRPSLFTSFSKRFCNSRIAWKVWIPFWVVYMIAVRKNRTHCIKSLLRLTLERASK